MESEKMIEMKLFSKQTDRKQTHDYQRGKLGGRDKLGVWDQHIHTTIIQNGLPWWLSSKE